MFQFLIAIGTFLVTFLIAPIRGVMHRAAVGLTMAAHVLEI